MRAIIQQKGAGLELQDASRIGMALSSITRQMREHPELRPLILHDVTPTGNTIGAGSYGSVEEVAIPGALCAAKKIHHVLAEEDKHRVTKEVVNNNIMKFVAECRIMGRLRHPNIVQFLGLWDEGSCLPAIVMEKMLMSLHDLLAPKSKSGSKPYIPLGLKCSILQDIARGIAYLHKQKPPVIHRDLTAANVLLNSAMVAKIADLGMARILPDKMNVTLTEAPGTRIYMPPEALEDRSKYNTSIDLFSLGIVAIFVLGQEFPCDLKAPTYTCAEKGLVARTELECREKYTAKIYSAFRKQHPLIHLIESCLDNTPKSRPSIDRVLDLLDQAMAEIQDSIQLQLNKLQLLRALKQNTELIHHLNKDLEDYRHQIKTLLTDLRQKEEEIASLRQSKKKFGNSDETIDGLHSALDKAAQQQVGTNAQGLRERMEHYKQERERLTFSVAQLQKELQAHRVKEQENQEMIREYTKQMHRYRDERNAAQAQNRSLEEQIKELQHTKPQRNLPSGIGPFDTSTINRSQMKKSPSQPHKFLASPTEEHVSARRAKKISAGEISLGDKHKLRPASTSASEIYLGGKHKPRAVSANSSSSSSNHRGRERVYVTTKDGTPRNVVIENPRHKLNPADLPQVIVKRKDGRYEMGVLTFLGMLDGTEMAGVVLDLPSGHTDGSWKDGRHYFQCPPRHGIYCKVSNIYIEVSTAV